ncbi:glutamate racemase [Spirochaetota bacterium]
MIKKAIGIFDSGVGGLTVAHEIHKLLPREDILYFGDTVHLPYGNKSEKAIINYSIQNIQFLLSKGVKLIVIACNTASSIAYTHLKNMHIIPIVNVLVPGALEAVSATKNNRIGIIGTFRTIRSKSYSNYIKKTGKNIRTYEKACPLFVPIIEEDFKNKNVLDMVIQEYLGPLAKKGIDTLILGCTHYPLIKQNISHLYPSLKIIDSAKATAKVVKKLLLKERLCSDNTTPKVTIYVNDKSEVFETITKKLFKNIDPLQIPPGE